MIKALKLVPLPRLPIGLIAEFLPLGDAVSTLGLLSSGVRSKVTNARRHDIALCRARADIWQPSGYRPGTALSLFPCEDLNLVFAGTTRGNLCIFDTTKSGRDRLKSIQQLYPGATKNFRKIRSLDRVGNYMVTAGGNPVTINFISTSLRPNGTSRDVRSLHLNDEHNPVKAIKSISSNLLAILCVGQDSMRLLSYGLDPLHGVQRQCRMHGGDEMTGVAALPYGLFATASSNSVKVWKPVYNRENYRICLPVYYSL